MTNAQETNVKQEPLSEQAFLDTLINLCDDLAWGRPASEDRLFALTKEGAGPKNYVRIRTFQSSKEDFFWTVRRKQEYFNLFINTLY